mmetsp:Transcript_12048/g.38163  ORF Transcript_12048/g.38163 Transcript_12048/m.38163 type:complete len:405 (-) Transcript_12048:915-2129(-)
MNRERRASAWARYGSKMVHSCRLWNTALRTPTCRSTIATLISLCSTRSTIVSPPTPPRPCQEDCDVVLLMLLEPSWRASRRWCFSSRRQHVSTACCLVSASSCSRYPTDHRHTTSIELLAMKSKLARVCSASRVSCGPPSFLASAPGATEGGGGVELPSIDILAGRWSWPRPWWYVDPSAERYGLLARTQEMASKSLSWIGGSSAGRDFAVMERASTSSSHRPPLNMGCTSSAAWIAQRSLSAMARWPEHVRASEQNTRPRLGVMASRTRLATVGRYGSSAATLSGSPSAIARTRSPSAENPRALSLWLRIIPMRYVMLGCTYDCAKRSGEKAASRGMSTVTERRMTRSLWSRKWITVSATSRYRASMNSPVYCSSSPIVRREPWTESILAVRPSPLWVSSKSL